MMTLIHRIIGTCKDTGPLISTKIDGNLPAGRSVRLKFHLLFCTACDRYYRQLKSLDTVLKKLLTGTTPPVSLPEEKRKELEDLLNREKS